MRVLYGDEGHGRVVLVHAELEYPGDCEGRHAGHGARRGHRAHRGYDIYLVPDIYAYVGRQLPAYDYAGAVPLRCARLRNERHGYAFELALLYLVGKDRHGADGIEVHSPYDRAQDPAP